MKNDKTKTRGDLKRNLDSPKSARREMKSMRIEYILKEINIVKGRVHTAFLGNDKYSMEETGNQQKQRTEL